MGLVELERRLQESMGLNAASIGVGAIARAVDERRLAGHFADVAAYLEHVRTSGAEFQALIEAVVVPETWFFRDRHALTTLGRHLQEVWLPSHSDGVASLLSLPCSTGEEPYSMAMALFDAGVPAGRFRIDAVDISAINIAQGVRGVYGRNSFRGSEFGFRDRHCEATAAGYRVREDVRRQVRFQQGNLFAPDLLADAPPYDVIFCRNVLIYFDRATQDRAIGVLGRLLDAKGLLFVAPAETALPQSRGLVSTHEPLAFAFRKAARLPARVSRPGHAGTRLATAGAGAVSAAVATRDRRDARPAIADTSRSPLARPGSEDSMAGLAEAARLADSGHFVEAAICVEQQLSRHGPSATAFYLLGLVRDASGQQADADAYYRKALYLDPDHYDAQIHLALLMAARGDAAAALVLRNRARRLEEKARALRE